MAYPVSSDQQWSQCSSRISAGAGLGRGSLETTGNRVFDIWSLTGDDTLGILSDLRIAELYEMPQSFSIKLHSETHVSGRPGMSGGKSPRHAQNPLSGERIKKLSQ